MFDPASRSLIKQPVGQLCLIDGVTVEAFIPMSLAQIQAKMRVNPEFEAEVESSKKGVRAAIHIMRQRKERVTKNEHEGVRIIRRVAFVRTEEFKLIYKKEPGSPGCSAPLIRFPSYSMSAGDWEGTFMELGDCLEHGINHLEVELFASVDRHYSAEILRPCGVVRVGQAEAVFKTICQGEFASRRANPQGVPGVCARHDVLASGKEGEQKNLAMGNAVSQGAAGMVAEVRKTSSSLFFGAGASSARPVGRPPVLPKKGNSKASGDMKVSKATTKAAAATKRRLRAKKTMSATRAALLAAYRDDEEGDSFENFLVGILERVPPQILAAAVHGSCSGTGSVKESSPTRVHGSCSGTGSVKGLAVEQARSVEDESLDDWAEKDFHEDLGFCSQPH